MPWETTLMNTGGRYTYGLYNEYGAFAISPDDMIHIRALGNNQKMGLSPIMQHAETIGMSGQKYTESFFSGNARPAGIVSVKSGLNKDSWGWLKDQWQKASQALRSQENKTMLLPADLDYKALTVSPVDAQIIDMMKLNRSMIAGIFNIPAHMINDLEKATFSNITQFYHFAITDGWMSRNEARAFEDMNPVDGLDEMLVSVNAANPLNDFKDTKGKEEKNDE